MTDRSLPTLTLQRRSTSRIPRRVLIVDDEADARTLLGAYLESHGLDVRTVDGAASMEAALKRNRPDLIVLDRKMPDEDGISICHRLAPKGFPIIMLSAMGSPDDRIQGLDIGADDYVTKPYDLGELLSRIHAVLRRHDTMPADINEEDTTYHFGGWTLSTIGRILKSPRGREVELSQSELALLMVFLQQPSKILSRVYLQSSMRRPEEAYDRMIDLHVSRLRRKLDDGVNGGMIQTLRGQGYMFMPSVHRT